MKMVMRSAPFSRAVGWGLLIMSLVGLLGPLLRAEEIRIRVLNGRNGKAVTNECLNVSFEGWHGADLVAPTNSDGVVVLHLEGNRVSADNVSSRACSRIANVGPKFMGVVPSTVAIAGDEYVVCQEYGKTVPGESETLNRLRDTFPSYSLRKILELGVSAGNTCGKTRVQAKPGELIIFVRSPSFLEKWRNW